MTVDYRNNIVDNLDRISAYIGDTDILDEERYKSVRIEIPNAPNHQEYSSYLSALRTCNMLSYDLQQAEADELALLTGRNYVDTYKNIFMVYPGREVESTRAIIKSYEPKHYDNWQRPDDRYNQRNSGTSQDSK